MANVVVREFGRIMLFITEGVLDTLEGYTHEKPGPDNSDAFRLKYGEIPRALTALTKRTTSPCAIAPDLE